MNASESNESFFIESIITKLADAAAARDLPCGSVVGDTFGGRSFTDNVATVLERRSRFGWWQFDDGTVKWTVIQISIR